ncbi:MAG: DUF4254 domain-containing protein [Bacteroidales bacterium]|nr:DUF4254 domain-containing protein [Bacteroidales bacterium]
MKTFSEKAIAIFDKATADYHLANDVNKLIINPHDEGTIESFLYEKNWIDVVQWHLEDIIRDPNIDPVEALKIKRTIDKSNQLRTDLVEQIDSYFLYLFKDVTPSATATINTESPAWALDRLSILIIKIYHMHEEATRSDASADHKESCQLKLNVLLEQRTDLSRAIDELLEELKSGNKVMKVYKQMKMYNDPALNPVLYAKK